MKFGVVVDIEIKNYSRSKYFDKSVVFLDYIWICNYFFF